MKLQGVRALITGANQGFGYAVAQRFVADGARVFLCARDAERLARAAADLSAVAPRAHADAGRLAPAASAPAPADAVRWMRADVAVPSDVDALVARAVADLGGLDVLVCNAGVYGPKGRIEDIDWNEWVQALNVNLCGAILCCRAVLPHLRAQKRGKIILLSGGGATKPMPFLSAYAASKAALVRFGETLAGEVQDDHIDVNSVAPGALNTRLLDEVLDAGPERVGKTFYEQSLKQQRGGGTSLDVGASLCAWLASADSDGITGRLISAVWDPWRDLAARRQELAASDIYTLRRIVPEERGKDWGQPK